ncbi:MAG: hypothetical protein RIS16_714, partial [Actinomycetota bacterium]
MIRQVDLRGKALSKSEYAALLPRAAMDVASALKLVEPILARVKSGDESDTPKKIRVPKDVIEKALAALDPALRQALEISIARVRKVHQDQIRQDKSTQVVAGGVVTEKWIPVDRVGLYVPGGSAIYPSSVMMNVVPAQ